MTEMNCDIREDGTERKELQIGKIDKPTQLTRMELS
jgi:hypothetical protein